MVWGSEPPETSHLATTRPQASFRSTLLLVYDHPMMDAKQFVSLIKHNSVDWSVKSTLKELNAVGTPQPPASVESSISAFINAHKAKQYDRARWFQQLNVNDREVITGLLRECAEKAIFSALTIIDGVDGDVPGVFEITEIIGDDRHVINPENSEMLHDLFSNCCEAEREGEQTR
jgi:hypothetical protein